MPIEKLNRHPKIAWLCNSAIGPSETFLGDNLKLLQGFANVKAFSGNKTRASVHPSVKALDFDDIPQRLHHILGRKLTGRDIRTLLKRKRCHARLFQELKKFNPDVLWIEFGTTAHVASNLIQALGKPYIISVHGFDVSVSLQDNWYKSEFVRLAVSSKKVLCASLFIQDSLINLGIPREKCQVIRLGVSPPTNTTNKKTKHPSFIHVGRLVQVKNPLLLIRAFHIASQSIPDAVLTIVGDGPLREKATALTRELDIANKVIFKGALNHPESLLLVEENWALCQAGKTCERGQQEAFGLSLAEAAVRGLPVVATKFGGIPEQVLHQKTGILVEEDDLQGFAEAIRDIALHPQKAMKLGESGRHNILNLCNPIKRIEALKSLISSIK